MQRILRPKCLYTSQKHRRSSNTTVSKTETDAVQSLKNDAKTRRGTTSAGKYGNRFDQAFTVKRKNILNAVEEMREMV
jgi:hypothetical protein